MNEKLKKRQEAKKAGCSFMNEREKGEFINLECCTVTLVDAYKIRKDDSEFWAFIVEEEPQEFYFANAGLASILDDAEYIAQEERRQHDNYKQLQSRDDEHHGQEDLERQQ